MSLVLEKPTRIGLGIDESTAVLIRPDGACEVLGKNQVIVYDARRADVFQSETGRLGGHGIAVHVLLPGDVFHFAEGTVERR
jgi:cyanophycinase